MLYILYRHNGKEYLTSADKVTFEDNQAILYRNGVASSRIDVWRIVYITGEE